MELTDKAEGLKVGDKVQVADVGTLQKELLQDGYPQAVCELIANQYGNTEQVIYAIQRKDDTSPWMANISAACTFMPLRCLVKKA